MEKINSYLIVFYACRWTIGECLNAVPDCPDQFLCKEWSTATTTELTPPTKTCPHLAAKTQALGLPSDQAEGKQHQHQHDNLSSPPLFSSNWLSLHATGLIATQQIQHQEDGVKCDKRKNYKYPTIKWSIEIKILYQQKRL